jgi:hypothetical protein
LHQGAGRSFLPEVSPCRTLAACRRLARPELGGDLEQAEQSLVKLRTDDLVWRQVGDEVMVLDLATSQYLSVNPTGSVLWPLLVEGSRRDDLVRELVEHFEVDEATAAADTEAFLSSLSNFLLPGMVGVDPGQ